jgi:ankyrin repeat protein
MTDAAGTIAAKKIADLRDAWETLHPSRRVLQVIRNTYSRASLIDVCEYGDLFALQELIAKKVNIRTNDDWALQLAALNGHMEIVRLLVENGADVHAGNDMPIRWAAEEGHLEIVKFLLERGADMTANNNVAIRMAAKNGHFDTVALLVKWGESLDLLSSELQEKLNTHQLISKTLDTIAQSTLTEVFNAGAWVGHVPEMLELWNQVPKAFQNKIDFSHIVSNVRSQSLKQSSGNKLKIIGRHKHDG